MRDRPWRIPWPGEVTGDIESAAAAARRAEAALHAGDWVVRMGARPFVARTQLTWSEMELARGDGARARELLADALTTADALGMVAVAERARGLLSANAVVAPASVDVGE